MSKEPAQKPDMFGGPDRSLEPSQGGKAQSAKKGQPRKKEAPKMDLLPLTPDNITAFAPTSSDVSYIHTIFSQCFFPLRPLKNGQKRYEVKHGRGTLLIKAGDLLDPRTGDMVEQDVPSGPAARLVMAHIQNHAKRAPTAEEAACIPMGESMRKFFAQYGKEMGGKQSRQIVQQVNNVAAMHMTIGLWKDNEARQINVPTLAEEIKFWLEKDKRQCTLWQPEMILDSRLVETIRSHAMPYDMRSIVALYKSAREMDMLLFLSYRLPFIPPRSSVFVPFFGPNGLHSVFGTGSKGNPREWKSKFLKSLKNVHRYYPDARITLEDKGLRFYRSPPPIPKDASELAEGRSLFFVEK